NETVKSQQTKLQAAIADLAASRQATGEREGQLATLQEDYRKLEEKFRVTCAERDALRLREDEIKLQLTEASAELHLARDETAKLKADVDKFDGLVAQVVAERDSAQGDGIRLQGVVDEIYRSTSWRLTAPVRGAKRALMAL